MSAQPSPLPRVVIVSHGQPSDPQIGETEISALARAVAQALPGRDIRGATLAAPGALEDALDGSRDALVYPFFMADGWFTKSVLPKRLTGMQARQLPPFGLDPDLPEFTQQWLQRVLDEAGWQAGETGLFLAAHGSGKSDKPAEVTRAFAQHLAALMPLRDIRCGFVEQPPFLADMARNMGDKAICLPFFALKRGHVLEDLPQALDAVNFAGLRLEPFGCQPELPAFIARRLALG
ncbi:sirohydrochlorin chelatase [Tropicibacter oceani]|uniref:Cobalamin biosynthesis protein CbiX n=1 Tax=Tropicibacter oceani TaxID=3058420 RepID=A0ABY8QGN8_9RHOB|nr:cobalamin biosynthesis protein CbiX [Tropicibacter oceani]WGW03598.1 cobalamin biosynthesis protein CbiX [Tropicibacter oceani]